MTIWSVVNDDRGGERRRFRRPRHLPRLVLLACLTLVVAGLGIAFRPGNPPEPPKPPFSERARSAALTEALQLRTVGEQLENAAAADAGRAISAASAPAAARTVSLLTTQARALQRPGPTPAAASVPPTTLPTTLPTTAPAPATAAGLAAGLARSGRHRLADAAMADGGMARLLAAVGTAQLVQATSLAAAAGVPDPAAASQGPDAGAPSPAGSCPAATEPPAGAAASSGTARGADLPGALAALIRTEHETVYGYQVALPRLHGADASLAAAQFQRHEALIARAEAWSRVHCAAVPPREPGYALDPAFLADPARGLAAAEASALPAYGDLVALSDGQTRKWAIAGLLEAARRADRWGAAPGPVPGLAADPAAFPALAAR